MKLIMIEDISMMMDVEKISYCGVAKIGDDRQTGGVKILNNEPPVYGIIIKFMDGKEHCIYQGSNKDCQNLLYKINKKALE